MSCSGNVGLSLGYPDVATSLSGLFGTFSKLVICAMMIRGRHRGMPYRLDRAVVLSGEREREEPKVEPPTARHMPLLGAALVETSQSGNHW